MKSATHQVLLVYWLFKRSNDWRLEDPYYGLLGAGGPGRAGVSPGEPLACRQYTGDRRQGGHMTRQAL